MSRDREWEIHNLNNIDLHGEDDVTNTLETIANVLIVLWSIAPLSLVGKNFHYLVISTIFSLLLFLTPSIYTFSSQRETFALLKEKIHNVLTRRATLLRCKYLLSYLRDASNFFKGLFFKEITKELRVSTLWLLIATFLATWIVYRPPELIKDYRYDILFFLLSASYGLIRLLFNRNFILYELLYRYRLKIKLITIEENLSPFSPLLNEFENIISGLNRNSKKTNKENYFEDSIIFFWIRKDKAKSRERSVQQFIPFLSLVTILFVLKEKSYKFVALVGVYFSLVGLLFITFHTYMLQEVVKEFHCDHATVSIFTITALVIWYLLTIYNIYNLIDISKYLKRINQTSRRMRLRKEFNFNKSYSTILETFDRDNAIYIYDYIFDKYLHVDSNFLSLNLNFSKRYVDRNIASLITIIISMVLVVFVEITANGVFQSNDINKTTTKHTYQYTPNSATLQIIKTEEKSGTK
ncbi:MAG TPA: hypothetical protein ENK74_04650 [Nitratifractor sp.]|nr:hypothetical protein [Nitratifractor sp.]